MRFLRNLVMVAKVETTQYLHKSAKLNWTILNLQYKRIHQKIMSLRQVTLSFDELDNTTRTKSLTKELIK